MKNRLICLSILLVLAVFVGMAMNAATSFAVKNTGEQIEDITGKASDDFAPSAVTLTNLGTKGYANVSVDGKYALKFQCYTGANRTQVDCKYKFSSITASPTSNYASAKSGEFKIGKNVTTVGFGAYSTASKAYLEAQTQ